MDLLADVDAADWLRTWGAALGNVATAAAVLVAFIAIWVEGRRRRLSLGVELLLRFSDRFHAPDMCRTRCRAAQALLHHGPQDSDEVTDVLNFMETLGLLIERRALPRKLAWNHFSNWLPSYWFACETYVATQRESDPNIWLHSEKLISTLLAEEGRMRVGGWKWVKPFRLRASHRQRDRYISECRGELQEFLERERSLGPCKQQIADRARQPRSKMTLIALVLGWILGQAREGRRAGTKEGLTPYNG